jgi:hypothetical protein
MGLIMKKALIKESTGECENIIVVGDSYVTPDGYYLADPVGKKIKEKNKDKLVNKDGVEYSFADFKAWVESQP